jgi:hypothetical protein
MRSSRLESCERRENVDSTPKKRRMRRGRSSPRQWTAAIERETCTDAYNDTIIGGRIACSAQWVQI